MLVLWHCCHSWVEPRVGSVLVRSGDRTESKAWVVKPLASGAEALSLWKGILVLVLGR